MRLLLLNLNYLRYQFFIKTMQNIFEILNTLPNEVIPYNNTENGVKRKVTNDK